MTKMKLLKLLGSLTILLAWHIITFPWNVPFAVTQEQRCKTMTKQAPCWVDELLSLMQKYHKDLSQHQHAGRLTHSAWNIFTHSLTTMTRGGRQLSQDSSTQIMTQLTLKWKHYSSLHVTAALLSNLTSPHSKHSYSHLHTFHSSSALTWTSNGQHKLDWFSLYYNLIKSQINQQIQNSLAVAHAVDTASQRSLSCSQFRHITHILRSLFTGWMYRIQTLVSLTCKFLTTIQPNYLHSLFISYEPFSTIYVCLRLCK